ncbi:tRNA-splicing endonuclease-like protein [Amniculicola lignicola CBS 123094]|uniref:tRNA-splicing endonuclease-like protein n=1 Tax=Amniculicola lignicola CBS 123094 TaxID=1392246 RepID=A0A6A5VV04_9PLEO|nr:tRNA-splicing endonuclease-like protein [Amniculicola lignicola CBS 123094]
MSDILDRVQKLQALPEDLHLFCPRQGSDSTAYYDVDIASLEPIDEDTAALEERKQKIKEAEERKWLALEALEILAFDGEEAQTFQTYVKNRLDKLMRECDVCIRVFHQSRTEWRNKLLENYDEELVPNFLQEVDKLCLQRITAGLDEAQAVLLKADPKQRSVRILPTDATYAFFEALSCDALIRNEELLRNHFDTPFQLVQSKRRLKLQTFVPAMTRFLFSRNEVRYNWASMSLSGFKRNILQSEFDWAVRDHLVAAMSRVQMSSLELPFVPLYWSGVALIVDKLGKELITLSLRSLEGEFYRLLLDHLSVDSDAFLDIVITMRLLLEKSPTDFWDAMDAITPSSATLVEQVFNSPLLKRKLRASDEDQLAFLDEAFSWISPLTASMKPANLLPVCRALVNQFFGRLQSDPYPPAAKARCFREGLKVLDYTFKKMAEGKLSNGWVGQPTVNGMLELLSTHIQLIVLSLKRFARLGQKNDLNLVLLMVQHAFMLEGQSLVIERQLISSKQPSPTETPPSRPIWTALIRAINVENIDLATHLLLAGRSLIGLEPLGWKKGIKEEPIPATIRHFNDRFALLSQSITEVIERLAEFDVTQLAVLLEQSALSGALVASLFSSTEDTRNATIELLKVISSQDERRSALQYILRNYYKNVLQGVSESCRMVLRKKAFAPTPSMIMTCSDIIDVMCNAQDGLLRSQNLDRNEADVTLNFWRSLWNALTMIFRTTEDWSNMGLYDKALMMDFCRDTMQFAEQLFDQCSIFATALKGAATESEEVSSRMKHLKELLEMPALAMQSLSRWLRLRDEFLSTKSASLISKLLTRLREVSIEVDADTLTYIEHVLDGTINARLSMQQQAELLRALETHIGRSLEREKPAEPVKPRQESLSKFLSSRQSGDDVRTKDLPISKMLAQATPSTTAFAKRLSAISREKEKQVAKEQQASEFIRKRKQDEDLRKKKRAEEIARVKRERGLSEHTGEAGSGLEGLGVLGKDQAPKGEGLMHSSDESDGDGDMDDDLFGIAANKKKAAGPKTNIVNEIKVQGPVKKRRVTRSIKDMRARLAPDLSMLHKAILGWDYFHEGDFPPNTRTDIYTAVPNTFRTPNEYQSTFEPLLTLEAWQGFVKAREENSSKPYEIRVVSRASVDAFQEVGSTMTHVENKELHISEGDVVLLSKSKKASADEPHCLARVFRVLRKQAHIEVSYRIMPGNPLTSSLIPNGTVFGSKIQSITPLEREYGALRGLMYYDLCDEIIRAKPSPILNYSDSQLDPLISTYNVNKAQAKAVKSAIDNDAFTLIQGPPGTGKTKTIVAIVGAILSDSLRNQGTAITIHGQPPRQDSAPKKLLVCAPSNAAVDELVMRFKDGVKTLRGELRKVNIVRLGRGDAINANVQDVTLEELVNKKLGVNPTNGNDPEKTRLLFQEHKQCSDQLKEARAEEDSGAIQGPEAVKLRDRIMALRRQKALLGTKIDNAKDNEKHQSRAAELNRRRAQESVLSNADVICATLSGSGHDMFQNFNIEFETVIVDEAAQCVEMSALIPLKYGCSKCILVGDPKQLPPTVFSREAARFQYEQSLFVRMQGNHPNDVHLLDTQYRMHPEISLFPSQTFYDGRLLDGPDMAGLRKRPWHKSMLLGPYRFFDVQGQHQAARGGHSLINIAEINTAMALYKRLTTDYRDYDFKGKIGIITPYKSQLRELKNRFISTYGASITDDVEFNTTDAFQGRESEVIIFSCVRASPAGGIGFLQDIRRMNVGLTRAKSSLWVLGNSQSLVRGEYWRKLVQGAQQMDRYTSGDVMNMLSKHSSKFPAPGDPKSYDMPIQQKGQQGFAKGASNNPFGPLPTSMQFKQEPKAGSMPDFAIGPNVKRKYSSDGDGDVKMEDIKVEDVDMLDFGDLGDSDAALPSAKNSGRSSPAIQSDATRGGSSTPAPDTKPKSAPAPNPLDVVGGMAAKAPKIRRRPREPVDPFIKRQPPKKPRMG